MVSSLDKFDNRAGNPCFYAVFTDRQQETFSAESTYKGVNPVHNPVPVQPGQHYMMGGIATDKYGRTILPGFYAAGECAAVSVHGANRLGANSLLDTLVFGRLAGVEASRHVAQNGRAHVSARRLRGAAETLGGIFARAGGEHYGTIRRELRETMTRMVGTFRTGSRLEDAQSRLKDLHQRYDGASLMDRGRLFNYDLLAFLETGFLLDLADTVVEGALLREESRGAHARVDFPTRQDGEFLCHFLFSRTPDGELKMAREPVVSTHYEPKARTY